MNFPDGFPEAWRMCDDQKIKLMRERGLLD